MSINEATPSLLTAFNMAKTYEILPIEDDYKLNLTGALTDAG
jgi:hypothetical protein